MCLLFFCKICKLLFLFPDVCCLTSYLQQSGRGGQQFVQISKPYKHLCWSGVWSHGQPGEANRLKLLLPVTAAEISIHAQMMITLTVYSLVKSIFNYYFFNISFRSEQKTINLFYLYLNCSSICFKDFFKRVFRSLRHINKK